MVIHDSPTFFDLLRMSLISKIMKVSGMENICNCIVGYGKPKWQLQVLGWLYVWPLGLRPAGIKGCINCVMNYFRQSAVSFKFYRGICDWWD